MGRRPYVEKELVRTGNRRLRTSRRLKKVTVSLAGMGLGDRIVLEAPLRAHRRNFPDDYLIALVDRNGTPDLPRDVRRHFDELWWASTGNGREWDGSPRSGLCRCVRDTLIREKVREVLVPIWKQRQIPRNREYVKRLYNCFADAEVLRESRVYPKLTVRAAERRWADRLLRERFNEKPEALVAIHVRNVWYSPERNIDLGLVRRMVRCLRRHGPFGVLLLGRDDGRPAVSGPDVLSLMDKPWTFEQTAAIIAQTQLFVGGESGLTHAAAALGVPLVAVNYFGDHAIPFTHPNRFLCFRWGESPRSIMAGIECFLERLNLIPTGRKCDGKQSNGNKKGKRRSGPRRGTRQCLQGEGD